MLHLYSNEIITTIYINMLVWVLSHKLSFGYIFWGLLNIVAFLTYITHMFCSQIFIMQSGIINEINTKRFPSFQSDRIFWITYLNLFAWIRFIGIYFKTFILGIINNIWYFRLWMLSISQHNRLSNNIVILSKTMITRW